MRRGADATFPPKAEHFICNLRNARGGTEYSPRRSLHKDTPRRGALADERLPPVRLRRTELDVGVSRRPRALRRRADDHPRAARGLAPLARIAVQGHNRVMAERPCKSGTDVKGIWRLLLPDTPFPACGTQEEEDAGGSAAGGRKARRRTARAARLSKPPGRGQSCLRKSKRPPSGRPLCLIQTCG